MYKILPGAVVEIYRIKGDDVIIQKFVITTMTELSSEARLVETPDWIARDWESIPSGLKNLYYVFQLSHDSFMFVPDPYLEK